jgi:hypothetical protein
VEVSVCCLWKLRAVGLYIVLPSRQNFSGTLVLHQRKLLGADEFCPFIPMLKDPQKANDQTRSGARCARTWIGFTFFTTIGV